MPDFGRVTRAQRKLEKPAKIHATTNGSGASNEPFEAQKISIMSDADAAHVLRRVLRYLEGRERDEDGPEQPAPVEPGAPQASDKRLAFLNEHFNGHGAAILK